MKTQNLIALTITILAFNACLESTYETISNVDIYTLSKQINNDTVYAIEAICNSNIQIKSVSLENGEFSSELELADNAGYTFTLVPEDKDFTTTPPTTGNYSFIIEFTDGSSATEFDLLENSLLDPLILDTIEYDADDRSFTIDWSEIEAVNYYRLLISDTTQVIFDSKYFSTENSDVSVSLIYSNWTNTPQSGDEIQFQLFAFKTESIESQQGLFQAVSPSNIIKHIFSSN